MRKDILIKHGDYFIECELDGLKMDYTYSHDPRFHTVVFLKNSRSYEQLKKELKEIYESWDDANYGFDAACDFLESTDCQWAYFADDGEHYYDLRNRDEIEDYLDEAVEKIRLMRSRKDPNPSIEARRQGWIEYLIEKYPDIPIDKNGCLAFSDWDCGYWNGIMGALRWVLGEEKGWLDM